MVFLRNINNLVILQLPVGRSDGHFCSTGDIKYTGSGGLLIPTNGA